MILPLAVMVIIKIFNFNEELRKLLYFLSVVLIQIGIFSTRWNVVIGGQLFSKSFRGLMRYKMELLGIEGLITSIVLLIMPLIILTILVKLLPPWKKVAENTV